MRVRRSGKEYEMTTKELEDYLRTTVVSRIFRKKVCRLWDE